MSIGQIKVNEIRKIGPLLPMINTVYNNFVYIADIPGLDHTRKEILRLLTSDRMVSLFAYHQEKLVGYLIGEFKKLGDGRLIYYIAYMYVAPKYRAKKIGAQLIALIVKKCENWGIKYITLTCDTHDVPLFMFYKKRGFTYDPMLRTMDQHEVMTKFL